MLSGLVLAVGLTGCATGGPPAIQAGQWIDRNGAVVDESVVIGRLQASDVILLGEVHDLDAVHRKQLALLRELGGPVVLALEQLDLGAGRPLVADGEPVSLDPRTRAARLGFDFDGWGWEHYEGLFALASERGWSLWPLNLAREKAIAVAMADEDEWQTRLGEGDIAAIEQYSPQLRLPKEANAALMADLRDAHCGRIDAQFAGGMARAQVARDVLMAHAVKKARHRFPDRQVVGVMGNQHARLDRGAGYWLEREGSKEIGELVVIGMLPVDSIDSRSSATEAYDLVWITDPVDRESRCDTRPEG